MTRPILLLIVFSMSQVFAGGAKEARALFMDFEQKVLSANLCLEYRTCGTRLGTVYGSKEGWKRDSRIVTVGELWLGDAGKFFARDECPTAIVSARKAEVRSDGASILGTRFDYYSGGEQRDMQFARWVKRSIHRPLRQLVTRLHAHLPLAYLRGPDQLPASETAKPIVAVSNFALGPKEREGTRALQVIEFDASATWLRGGRAFRVQLWLDTKTNLPTKRVVRTPEGRELSETYARFELSPELPPGVFTIPKGAEAKPPGPRPGK